MTFFAFTHSEPVETRQRLRDLERHGLRVDRLARENLRPGAVAGAGLDWPDDSGRRLTKAYADFKKRNDVDPRKGAQLLHSIGIGVSPGWITEAGGNLHDPANPRNVRVFEAAIAWVKSIAGDDAVVSARMDLDEEGGGWVDVYFAPIRQEKYKGRAQTKRVISVNKCLEETAVRLGYPKGSHYSALNTGWAKYAQQHLDAAIERGKPGRDTGKEHLTPRQYKAEQEAKKKAAAAEVREKEALDQKAVFEAATTAIGADREELKQSFEDNAKTLLEIFTNPHLDNLEPRPPTGTWKVPPSFASQLRKLGPLVGAVLKVLEAVAAKMAEIRARLDAIVEREQQLDQAIGELAGVQDRLKAEDAQVLERARVLVSRSEGPASIDDPSPW
ncbi:hypothetical protein [uncultured Devosia sp.]|uniref:hypothetical protein n=1 Tax=uncultured Devosia sp. TaxID=211434 RepID=UPI0030EEFAE3|tara:strand:- start:2340 stop:3500 length:1161 start_codon:yes stop_codon:yes gene_type:complete